jgi:hypothetical protein
MCCGSIFRLCAASLVARPCLRPLASSVFSDLAPATVSPHGSVLRCRYSGARCCRRAIWRAGRKRPEEVMEILEAYDLTGSFR